MSASKTSQSTDPKEKLFAIIRDIRIGMLATARGDGRLHMRPMVTHLEEADGPLWFFTAEDSPKAEEIASDRHVAIGYTDAKRQMYAVVSGTARLVQDHEVIRRLWSPTLVTWFPKGMEDPNLALLRVDVSGGEYWDAPSSTMVEIMAAVQSGLAHPPPIDSGDHAKVRM